MELPNQYKMALRSYLAGEGESALKDAYLLGRHTLEHGDGVMAIASAHHQALAAILRSGNGAQVDSKAMISQAGAFLAECLSPFEMAQRGFQETITALNALNERLELEVEKRTEAMRESEERYRTLVQTSPDAITVTDLTDHIVLSNLQAALLHGYADPSEELGSDASRFVAPEHLDEITAMARRLLEKGEPQRIEYSLLTGGGMRVPVEARVSLVRDNAGQPVGFLGVVRDISERKRAEEEKQLLIAENERQRQRLQTLVAQLPGVVWEAWGEPDTAAQRVDFVSDYVETMLGYSVQEWLSTPNFWLTIVDPADRQKAEERSSALFASGEPGVNEYRWVSKSGRKVWVEAQSIVIRDADGTPIGMRGVTMDVTQRKEAEMKLATQAEQRAAAAILGQIALAESSLDHLMRETVKLVTETMHVEFCELLELQPDTQSLILREGQGLKDGYVGNSNVSADAGSQAGYTLLSTEPVYVKNLATDTRFAPPELLTQHGVVSGVTVIIHSDGHPYGVLGAHTSQPREFTADEGNFLQSLANTLAMAIKNRRLLGAEAERRRAAERSNEERLRGLAIIAHELRTPLSSIKGFASTLLADDVEWDAAQQRDFIQTIDDEADKLSNLLEQLLDLSKMEAGVFSMTIAETSLQEILSRAMGQLKACTRQHNLVINIPKSLPPVRADILRAGQILVNLAENAAKYSPLQSTITISATTDEQRVIIHVKDQGPGIPLDEREKIFLPFYRSITPNAPKAKGAGLGLFICQKLAQAQDGKIQIEDSAGPGTTFSLALPLARQRKNRAKKQ